MATLTNRLTEQVCNNIENAEAFLAAMGEDAANWIVSEAEAIPAAIEHAFTGEAAPEASAEAVHAIEHKAEEAIEAVKHTIEGA